MLECDVHCNLLQILRLLHISAQSKLCEPPASSPVGEGLPRATRLAFCALMCSPSPLSKYALGSGLGEGFLHAIGQHRPFLKCHGTIELRWPFPPSVERQGCFTNITNTLERSARPHVMTNAKARARLPTSTAGSMLCCCMPTTLSKATLPENTYSFSVLQTQKMGYLH